MNRPLALTALALTTLFTTPAAHIANTATATTSAPAARVQKVLVIGIDGALLSKIQAFDTPALKSLISSGRSEEHTSELQSPI